MILFVDEEPRWVRTYIEALRDADYEVTHATTVDEALVIFRTKMAVIELIILDVMMPPGYAFKDEDTVLGTHTGLFIFEKIREIASHLPIIILTNVTEPDVSQFFQSRSCCWLLRKEDYDPFAVVDKVQDVLASVRVVDCIEEKDR